MNESEFTAMRVTVLVRSQPKGGPRIKEFFDSVPFQYQMQDALGNLMKQQLTEGEVDFEEVIINLDAPAEKAKKVQQKPSLMGRLLGKS